MAKKIPLGKHGRYSMVDDSDYEMVSQYKWSLQRCGNSEYAMTTIKGKNVKMHRFIMNPPDGMVIDHLDHDGLNNRRANMRICTYADNSHNRRMNRNNKSGVTGVYRKRSGKYVAQIMANYRTICLGTFPTLAAAAKARADAELRWWKPQTHEAHTQSKSKSKSKPETICCSTEARRSEFA